MFCGAAREHTKPQAHGGHCPKDFKYNRRFLALHSKLFSAVSCLRMRSARVAFELGTAWPPPWDVAFIGSNRTRALAATAFKTQHVAGCGCDQNKPSTVAGRRRRQDKARSLPRLAGFGTKAFAWPWLRGLPLEPVGKVARLLLVPPALSVGNNSFDSSILGRRPQVCFLANWHLIRGHPSLRKLQLLSERTSV